jgi:hypothetical protein
LLPNAQICVENTVSSMNPSTPQGNEPKIPRREAEAMVKLMEQELALKRAQLAAEKGKMGRPSERWMWLMLILLVLLGLTVWAFIYGWGRIQNYKSQTPDKPLPPPPAAPARR